MNIFGRRLSRASNRHRACTLADESRDPSAGRFSPTVGGRGSGRTRSLVGKEIEEPKRWCEWKEEEDERCVPSKPSLGIYSRVVPRTQLLLEVEEVRSLSHFLSLPLSTPPLSHYSASLGAHYPPSLGNVTSPPDLKMRTNRLNGFKRGNNIEGTKGQLHQHKTPKI